MNMMEKTSGPAEPSSKDVLLEKQNRCGVVTLNRPKAMNALTIDMIEDIDRFYVDCMEDHHIYGIVLQSAVDGVFCTGGDIRAIHGLLSASDGPDVEKAKAVFAAEYQHNWTLERFNKPNIALLNGNVMGGGAGIALYGTHRVAGEHFSFAMPETRIGFFPDVGVAFKFARLPAHIGEYLGLTGHAIDAADAYALGLVSHVISSAHFDDIRAAMIESDPIDPILEDLHEQPAENNLASIRPWVIDTFSAPTVEEIIARLETLPQKGGQGAGAWAEKTVEALSQRCPLSLKVTLRHIREAKKDTTLKETLARDYLIATRFMEGAEFKEGVRAYIIDKDRSPNWPKKTLADVSPSDVDAYFSPLKGSELTFIDYGSDGDA